jgi:DNA-binding NarL/FixJ family response regulator
MESTDRHSTGAGHNGPIGTVAESGTNATTAMSAIARSAEGLTLLSKREEEVLELMASGLATGEIAERLAICPTTVRNHVQRILEKLSVHKRLPAVLIWMLGHR